MPPTLAGPSEAAGSGASRIGAASEGPTARRSGEMLRPSRTTGARDVGHGSSRQRTGSRPAFRYQLASPEGVQQREQSKNEPPPSVSIVCDRKQPAPSQHDAPSSAGSSDAESDDTDEEDEATSNSGGCTASLVQALIACVASSGHAPEQEVAHIMAEQEQLARSEAERRAHCIRLFSAKHATQISLAPGRPLLTQGEPSDALFCLLTGTATCSKTLADGSVMPVEGVYRPGELFGELGFVFGVPPASTVYAGLPDGSSTERVVVARLSRSAAIRTLLHKPREARSFFWHLAHRLAEQVHALSESLRSSSIEPSQLSAAPSEGHPAGDPSATRLQERSAAEVARLFGLSTPSDDEASRMLLGACECRVSLAHEPSGPVAVDAGGRVFIFTTHLCIEQSLFLMFAKRQAIPFAKIVRVRFMEQPPLQSADAGRGDRTSSHTDSDDANGHANGHVNGHVNGYATGHANIHVDTWRDATGGVLPANRLAGEELRWVEIELAKHAICLAVQPSVCDEFMSKVAGQVEQVQGAWLSKSSTSVHRAQSVAAVGGSARSSSSLIVPGSPEALASSGPVTGGCGAMCADSASSDYRTDDGVSPSERASSGHSGLPGASSASDDRHDSLWGETCCNLAGWVASIGASYPAIGQGSSPLPASHAYHTPPSLASISCAAAPVPMSSPPANTQQAQMDSLSHGAQPDVVAAVPLPAPSQVPLHGEKKAHNPSVINTGALHANTRCSGTLSPPSMPPNQSDRKVAIMSNGHERPKRRISWELAVESTLNARKGDRASSRDRKSWLERNSSRESRASTVLDRISDIGARSSRISVAQHSSHWRWLHASRVGAPPLDERASAAVVGADLEMTTRQFVATSASKDALSIANLGALTHKEWQLMLGRSRLRTYSRGHVVKPSGSRLDGVLQVVRGSLSVQISRATHPQPLVVGHVAAGEMIGDVSLLLHASSPFTCVVDSDRASIVAMRLKDLEGLFSAHPAIACKFYIFLANRLAEKLRQMAPEVQLGPMPRDLANAPRSLKGIASNPAFLMSFYKFVSSIEEADFLGPLIELYYGVRALQRESSSDAVMPAIWHLWERHGKSMAPRAARALPQEVRNAMAIPLSPGYAEGKTHAALRHAYDGVLAACFEALEKRVLDRFLASSHYDIVLQLSAKEAWQVSVHDFRLARTFGDGVFGQVLEVIKKDCGKRYAMKIIEKEAVMDAFGDEWQAQLLNERQLLAALHHPLLANLAYAFQNVDYLVLVMDICYGGDLAAFGTFGRLRLTAKQFHFVGLEVCAIIVHLQRNRVLYRDLKPQHLLVDGSGHVRLIDFGMAERSKGSTTPTSTWRCGGSTVGSVYLAPEVKVASSEHPYGAGCACFSFGVTLYELKEKRYPFGPSPKYLDVEREFKQPMLLDEDGKQEMPHLYDLLSGLLDWEPQTRLGHSTAGDVEVGIAAMQAHPFWGYPGTAPDWELIDQRLIPSPLLSIVRERLFAWESKGHSEARQAALLDRIKLADARAANRAGPEATPGLAEESAGPEDLDFGMHVDDWDFCSSHAIALEYVEAHSHCVAVV